MCLAEREGLLALRARPAGRRRLATAFSAACGSSVEPTIGNRGFESFTRTSKRKRPHAGDLLCLAEREGFEPSMEFPPYTLSRGAPSATRPSLQYFPRGAPMALRTMSGCAITRDCVPRPFGAAVAMRRRSATAFGCLVSHSAISPILSTWRTNGPADHAEARDYPGQSPMRTTRESHQANVCFCGTALDARFQLRRRTTSGVSQLSAESPFSRLIRS